MSKRKTLQEADPKAFQAMMAFENYLAQSPLTKTHAELIKIRVSQINGCAYCINKHTKDARAAGETEQRIFLLSAWKEVPLFSEEEKAILALVEEMTLIAEKGVSDEVYNKAIALLGQSYATAVIMGIVAMNAWNRIGITTAREVEG
ncbi:carboxymuconolactone decarboxylase family protein [Olivibacter domesticus]|uniref:Alkylhydroperoxidase AhpD family core domain-containing protein n=1 Tax=Olivibacter domesticus TaxID=407022 RepID=A0A1H7Z615_OLID1|nr:carboxymuconolactone decarboxylase family protein [Olivibacter domesticus]SEM53643.1 alkylhydroperoxidase AhpD family core domain-containing protein [Olivibacter domesticus]